MGAEHADGDGEYWFDPRTGEVSRDRRRSWQGRMGPYRTREEAEQALDRAADRTEAWDEEDRRRSEEDQLWGED
ncbi:hypothetical protein [Cellulomonas bogoriensis]|uniref:SPOR domain-containing protein n=1 Tax=Cellulomonas bogoriensis 69B4 = DSM 16987 TaxID=1386082 RepID=A0A0A0C208_9CELL|nr:hypothetical protein [Cellulomonas bogoriensis]KGM14027.1 hypothetical protein N869_06105 [Cellulomonas bogoriensis 69B4 = DSM 16987]